MFNIRKFESIQDTHEVLSWYEHYDIPCEWINTMPENTSYLLEIDGKPGIAACLLLTKCQKLAFIENAIGNPELEGPKRAEGLQVLFKHLEDEAKNMGYKVVLILAEENKLKSKYINMGYAEAMHNVTVLSKLL